MKLSSWKGRFAALAAGVALLAPGSLAWDYDNHRVVNLLALEVLPSTFPRFALEPDAQERIAFLAGEPDRWRNTTDFCLRHVNGPDHFFDIDYLADLGMEAGKLSRFRLEYLGEYRRAAEAHPGVLPDPGPNADKTRDLIGFLPWSLAEHYSKLKSAFSYLKVYEELGTPAEVSNARQNVVSIMGEMGHFAGDASQPLHTSKHFNGWVGANPEGYTTNRSFHAWIDGGFTDANPPKPEAIRALLAPARRLTDPAKGPRDEQVFRVALAFLESQNQRVEPLYKLEKAGKLKTAGSAEGLAFITKDLAQGAQFLADLWLTAWEDAHPDAFLRRSLTARKAEAKP